TGSNPAASDPGWDFACSRTGRGYGCTRRRPNSRLSRRTSLRSGNNGVEPFHFGIAGPSRSTRPPVPDPNMGRVVFYLDPPTSGLRKKMEPSRLTFLSEKDNRRWEEIGGWLLPSAAEALYRYTSQASPQGAVVEIGSFAGKSTVCIARALKDN